MTTTMQWRRGLLSWNGSTQGKAEYGWTEKTKERKLPTGQPKPLESVCFPKDLHPALHSPRCTAWISTAILGSNSISWAVRVKVASWLISKLLSAMVLMFTDWVRAYSVLCKGLELLSQSPREAMCALGTPAMSLKYAGYAKADTELIFIPAPPNDSWRVQPLVNNSPQASKHELCFISSWEHNTEQTKESWQ
jgi:hypothetical protein